MATETTFEVLESPHIIGPKVYEKGSRITTADPLDKMFPGKFRKVGSSLLAAAKRAKQEEPAEQEPDKKRKPADAVPPEQTDETDHDAEHDEDGATAEQTDEQDSTVSADDVDVSQEFPLAVRKKVMVKLTAEKTYKVIDSESENLLEEGLSKADLKRFLKTYEPDEK